MADLQVWAFTGYETGVYKAVPLALAALGGEVSHEILVGVAKDVVVLSTVFREIKGGVLKDAYEVFEALNHRISLAELVRVVEVGKVAAG